MHELLVSKGIKPRRGKVFTCVCGKEFYRTPAWATKFKSYYCSKKCWNNQQKKQRNWVACYQCKKEFTRYPSQLKDRNFCSYECSSVWRKEDIKDYLVHPVEETRKGGRKKMQDGIWSSKYADKIFSEWIRARDKRCINCGRTSNLTCSHFWGRGNSATRYDPENCDTLCWMPCHFKWEKQKQGEYMKLKIKQLGKKGYAELEKRARSIVKRKDAIIHLMSWLT